VTYEMIRAGIGIGIGIGVDIRSDHDCDPDPEGWWEWMQGLLSEQLLMRLWGAPGDA
jgi:hypothetical protein